MPECWRRGLRGAQTGCEMQSEYENFPDLQRELRRYQTLLDMTDLMVRQYSLPELFHELAQRPQKVTDFQLLNFSLHDPERNLMRLHLWEGEPAPEIPDEVPVGESASGWVWEHQTALLFRNLQEDRRFPRVLDVLRIPCPARKAGGFASAGRPPPKMDAAQREAASREAAFLGWIATVVQRDSRPPPHDHPRPKARFIL
jgi:hypothetical protein